MQRYHVRLIATFDRYIEATGPEQAEQMAIERCRAAVEPLGFPVQFHRSFDPHLGKECQTYDPEIMQVTLEF